MYRLTNAYDSSNAPTIASIVIGIGVSLLFSTGLFLTINAHDKSQSAELQQTIAAVRKSQDEGISISQALSDLRSSSLLKKSSGSLTKGLRATADNDFDSLNVKSESNLQGNVKVSKDFSVNGNLNVKGKTKLNSDVAIGGDLGVSGNSLLQSGLSVDGDTQLNGDLGVTGSTILSDSLEVTGSATVASLNVSGAVTLDDSLEITQALTLGDSLEVTGSTTVGSLSVHGAATFDDTLEANNANLHGALDVTGDVTVDANLHVNGTTLLNHGLEITGDGYINGGLTVQAGGLTATGNVYIGSVADGGSNTGTINSTANVAGNLSISQADADSTVNISGAFTVSGTNGTTISSAGGVNIGQTFGNVSGGSTTLTNSVSSSNITLQSGNLSIGQTLGDIGSTNTNSGSGSQTITNNVTSTTTVNGNIAVQGASSTVTFGDNVKISGNLTTSNTAGVAVSGDLTVGPSVTVGAGNTGTINAGTINMSGNITLQGASSSATFSGDNATISSLALSGSITVNSGGSIIHSDGDLTITNGSLTFSSGGATVNNDLNVSGNLNVTTLSGGGGTVTGTITAAHLVAGTDIATLGTVVAGGTGTFNLNSNYGYAVCHSGANGAGQATLSDCTSGPNADYAENYPVANGATYGDIVSMGTTMVNTYAATSDGGTDWDHVLGKITQLVRSSTPYQSSSVGILSDNHSDFTSAGYNIKPQDNPIPVALNGRVLVNIAPSSDPIEAGDYLTTSSVPGKAMKATGAGYVIGKALAAWTPGLGQKQVMVFVEPGYYPGPNMVNVVQNGGDATLNNLGVTGNASFANLNVTGPSTLVDLQVTGLATINNLQVTGLATVNNLQVNGHIIGNDDTRGTVTIPAGTTTTHHTFASPYGKIPSVVASPMGQAVLYSITPTATGFDINLPSPAAANVSFSYQAQE